LPNHFLILKNVGNAPVHILPNLVRIPIFAFFQSMIDKNHEIDKLVELNDELENYFRNTIIPQMFVDANLVLRKFTPPAMKQFNLASSDVGRYIRDITDNIRFPTIVENIQHVIDNNEILEKEIQTNDMRWYQMNIIPYVIQKSNKANGVIITFIDITVRIADLKEQEKLISDYETLLDTISHDIKNPLTHLILSVQVLKTIPPTDSSQTQKILQNIDTGILKVKTIIDELTDSRRRQYKYKEEEELLNFEHILEDARFTLADNIKQSGAEITSNIGASEITFSRRKLRSILYNLILNAIKYKSPDRKPIISVTTATEDNFIVVSVKDNGLGIAEDKQEAIFTKYYRAEESVEGTGIGLYLIKANVTSSGGKIEVKSTLGEGSEFRVFLKIK